ncbi:degenerate transposase (orf2) [Streptococcus pneumoniae]|nr:degenerate transposase (orf2) [Streptococcus pneumoniae]
MSFIAQDFDNLNIITVLEGRTQAIIRNHFLRLNTRLSSATGSSYNRIAVN